MLALLLTGTAYGQSPGNTRLTVSNVRVELDTQRVKIVYDVANLIATDSVYIQVESRRNGFFKPKTVTGAVGKGVSSGANQTIYWDYRLDGVNIEDEIRVTVLAKPVVLSVSGGGPANALLSALVPGLGSILVQPNRKTGWRPVITATYGGLLAYGLVQRSRSKEAYQTYESQTSEPQAEPYYNRATQHHHRYLVATRVAAVVWAADVTYAFLKGMKNGKKKRASVRKVVAGWVGTTPTLGFSMRF
ncbi:hypothetical protein [Larkinella humicola]|uniref:DUF5683 domain-containing protein n=1 Tax=Larkinella humicola TaxID=2607654 RepID=A0A5N1J726_9BACT|nr:hypothetical protein [Larkinella humicola]KAA9346522.1 hypothetical protein F0P93_28510 [Larkinella humicola]